MAAVSKVLREFLMKDDCGLKGLKEQADAYKKNKQDDCPHLQGSAIRGGYTSELTSIVWHTFEDDPDHQKGICTNCQRIFSYTDPDYKIWHSKPSGNLPSTGGLRPLRKTLPLSTGRVVVGRKCFECGGTGKDNPCSCMKEPELNISLEEFVALRGMA